MWTREGLRIKYLPQEPDLDSSLNVMENIRRGIAEQVEKGHGVVDERVAAIKPVSSKIFQIYRGVRYSLSLSLALSGMCTILLQVAKEHAQECVFDSTCTSTLSTLFSYSKTLNPPPCLHTVLYDQEDLMTRFEETGIAMGDPDADLDALLEEQAALQAKIEDADAWNLQVKLQHSSMRFVRRQTLFRSVGLSGFG